MIDLYLLASLHLLLLFLFGLLVFAVQCVYLGTLRANQQLRRGRIFVGELLLLIYLAILTMIPLCIYAYRQYGIVHLRPLEIALFLVGAVAVLYFVLPTAMPNRHRIVLTCAALLGMPLWADLLPLPYHVFWVASLGLLFARTCLCLCDEIHRQRNELSTTSIKEGLDTLPAGILFCDAEGYIFLTNLQMQALMLRFFGTELKNGAHLWARLTQGELLQGVCLFVQNDILVHNEHDAWRFSRRRIGTLDRFEITAIDVTESFKALKQLEQERDELLLQTEETQQLAATMEAVRREQEYLRICAQVHDILGQRLSAMQRLSQSGNVAHYSALLTHSREAIRQIKQRRQENAQVFFDEIITYFQNIGLSITVDGALPAEASTAFAFLAVLREACTNAVQHAGASQLVATVHPTPTDYHIEICNNGTQPTQGIVEGSGLFGIRTRVEGMGGVLRVEVMPAFSLRIILPKEGVPSSPTSPPIAIPSP